MARYEYRHYIIFGAASEFAALATECAGDQGAWWKFHDEYMLDARARKFTRAGAIDLASEHELNVAQFTRCIDNEEHAERIIHMQLLGKADGVSATPTFRINGRPGATSPQAMIDQVRAEAEAAGYDGGG